MRVSNECIDVVRVHLIEEVRHDTSRH
jgi:hypothetical protein